MTDQQTEWKKFCAEQLAKGICPDSGLRLTRHGEAGPTRLSCDVCDCFGYPLVVTP